MDVEHRNSFVSNHLESMVKKETKELLCRADTMAKVKELNENSMKFSQMNKRTLIVIRSRRWFTQNPKSFVDFNEFFVKRFISCIRIGMKLKIENEKTLAKKNVRRTSFDNLKNAFLISFCVAVRSTPKIS